MAESEYSSPEFDAESNLLTAAMLEINNQQLAYSPVMDT